jgi:hypothetical protein
LVLVVVDDVATITTVYATGPDVADASSLVTWRHHVPGLSVPESGVALAERSWVVPAGTVQLVPTIVPMPIPNTTDGFKVPPGRVSTADVSVTVTLSPVVGVVLDELLSQAAVVKTITSATRLKCFMTPFPENPGQTGAGEPVNFP